MLYAIIMRATFTILTILIALQANSQNYIRTIESFDTWAGQLEYDYVLLSRFDKYCKENNLLTDIIGYINAQGDNSWYYTKAVDINNDGLRDIFYSGPTGGEPSIVYIFLQTKTGFEQVFNVMQSIDKVEWEDEKIARVFTSDWGCCAEFHLTHSIFDVRFDELNKPIFNKVYQTIEVSDHFVKPMNYFTNSIEFEVDNDGYKLRLAPVIDDTTFYDWVDITGNSIATLKKGTKGIAYASKTDETDRVWWYVSIEFDENVQNCVLFAPDDFPTQVVGWISSRYVTKIEN